MDIIYKTIKISENENNKYLKELMNLSKIWAEEKTCPSYDPSEEKDFIDKDVYVAIDDDKIIAFAVGYIKELKEKTSYNKVGEKTFKLDEIYVLKEYRNQKIGSKLYNYLENELKDKVDLIALDAVSYNYKSLLKFYIEDLGMEFKYALVVKRI